jgi:hypothetical protein
VVLNADETSLDLTGWVTLTNTSGATFNDAQLKLVAGELHRIQPQRAEVEYAYAPTATAMATQGVEQREFFEYQLYEVGRPVTVQNNETKQIEFVSGQNVPATKYFVYEPLGGYYYNYAYYGSPLTDQYYGQSTLTDIKTFVEFSTGEGGLDADMPAGRVRVFQKDVDGSPLLIGEDAIDHTPNGEKVQLYVGNAFDLVGERTQTDFRYTGSASLTESYSIRLRNRKDDEPVEIRVVENMFRWSNWEIIDSNFEYTKVSAFAIEYRITVNPGEEVELDYTVRYEW